MEGFDWLAFLALPVFIIAIVVVIVIIPNKRNLEKEAVLERKLKVGTKVMTTAGIFGSVAEIVDNHVILTMFDGSKIEFSKAAIAKIIEE